MPRLYDPTQRRARYNLLEKPTAPCPGHARHWFTVHGEVGNRVSTCVRCGTPNPRYKEQATKPS